MARMFTACRSSIRRGFSASLVGMCAGRVGPVVWAAVMVGLCAVPERVAHGSDVFESGVAMVPRDAAFVSSSLRMREQYEKLIGSNAFAAVRKLPFVVRALEALEEQKTQPGSPLSMMSTFMELPENQQALELLQDMVATDTFLYGEPSCITFLELMQKIQRAQQAASIIQMSRGGDVDFNFEVEEMDDVDAPDNTDARGGAGIVPVRLQAAEVEEGIESQQLVQRMVMQALAGNVDSIVVPDVVWGFKTSKLDTGASQLKRIEVLLKMVTQTSPLLGDALKRTKIAGGEVVSLTLDGSQVPWREVLREQMEGVADEDADKVLAKLESLDIVIAVGLIGDRVILSLGDSIDHLNKLVVNKGSLNAGGGVMTTPAFAPLREHKDRAITGIFYMSEALARVIAPTTADIEQLAQLSDTLADSADLPEEAAVEARKDLEKIAASYKKRLPVPGPMMSYAFLGNDGYEGYVWDWSKNLPLDGTKRLDMLEHSGGTPLAALVLRTKIDPAQFEDFVSWGNMGWSYYQKYLLPKAGAMNRDAMQEVQAQVGPVVRKFVDVLRTKILPSVADGQMGFVIDNKARAKRVHSSLPESAEPLPLLEPAITLKLDDSKLFREGMSDLFVLADELVDKIREINPDSLPPNYRVPDPEKTTVEGGAVWSFAIPDAGLDEQVSPSIGVGEKTAVFAFLPKQAARLLVPAKLETGAQIGTFAEPLAAAAALDVAGFIDAVRPWLVYMARYGAIQQQQGSVDRDTVLGPDAEDGQVRDALQQMGVLLDSCKSLRVAVAETSMKPDATVTHWRNVIRDTPAAK